MTNVTLVMGDIETLWCKGRLLREHKDLSLFPILCQLLVCSAKLLDMTLKPLTADTLIGHFLKFVSLCPPI